MHVRQPVKIDPEKSRLQFAQVFFGIEAPAAHHQEREVDDARAKAVSMQIRRERQEADRVHREDRRRRNDVADRSERDSPLAKVEDARRMNEYDVGLARVVPPYFLSVRMNFTTDFA